MAIIPRMKLSTKGELLVCVSCAVYVVYYILVVVRKPRLVCRAGRLRRFLSSGMDDFIRNYYWAPIWCFGANMQCLVGFLYNSWLPRLSYRRELLVLSDRGLVALDWVNEDQPGPVVILAGGGFTDSQSRPWRALLPALTALGNPCVMVNGRGCGGVPLTTHRITYAASVSDFAEKVVEADKVFSCWTLSSFNKRYAAPVYGFPSVEDFYEHCSLKGRLGMVQRPLVFLVSSDDPLNPRSASLEEEIMKSPWLAAVVTPRGGHMGFVDGWLWPRQPFYLERFVTSFVQGVHRVCKSRGVQVLHNLGE